MSRLFAMAAVVGVSAYTPAVPTTSLHRTASAPPAVMFAGKSTSKPKARLAPGKSRRKPAVNPDPRYSSGWNPSWKQDNPGRPAAKVTPKLTRPANQPLVKKQAPPRRKPLSARRSAAGGKGMLVLSQQRAARGAAARQEAQELGEPLATAALIFILLAAVIPENPFRVVKAPPPSPLQTFGPLVLATLSLIGAGAVILGGESEPKASAVPSSPPPARCSSL